MSSPLPTQVVQDRIHELERELAGLRSFSTADAPQAEETHSAAPKLKRQLDGVQDLLLCEAASLKLALPLQDIKEVVPIARLQPVPGASQCVIGSLGLRGKPVIVHDLSQHLTGVREPLTRTQLILVSEVQGGLVGIKVTNALDIIRGEIFQVPVANAALLDTDIVLGVCSGDIGQLTVLDIHAIARGAGLGVVVQ